MDFKILKELKEYLPPLTENEYHNLEKSCVKDGIRDRITVWQEENALVDGMNRYQISKAHSLPVEVNYKSFQNIDEVKKWMDENQLGKRNLNKTAKSIVSARSSQKKDRRQLSLFNSFEKIQEVLPQSIINKIMNGEIEGFTESDLISMENKTEEQIEKFFAPIMDGKTNSIEKAKEHNRPKSRGLKDWEKLYAIEFAKSFDTLASFREVKKPIHKVEASKLKENLEWWREVESQWRKEASLMKHLTVTDAISMFEHTYSMLILDAHKVHVDERIGSSSKVQDFTILCDLFNFWDVVDNCPKFKSQIKDELVRLSDERKAKPKPLRCLLTEDQVKKIKTIIENV